MSSKGWLIGLFLVCLCAKASSVEPDSIASIEAWDASWVDVRAFSSDTIDYYKQQPEYTYDIVVEPESFWDRFMYWLLTRNVDGSVALNWLGWVLLAIAVLALVFLIIKVMGVPIKSLFVFSKPTPLVEFLNTEGSDIGNVELDKLLPQLIEEEAYREATRVRFILLLRFLNQNDIISWSVYKTDKEYYYEITDAEIKKGYLQLMRQYEYVWYGQFVIDKLRFGELLIQFDELCHLVNPKRTKVS